MRDSREKEVGIWDQDPPLPPPPPRPSALATNFHSSPPSTHKQNQTFISVIYTDIRSHDQLKPYCEIAPLYPSPPDMMGRSLSDEQIVEGGAACNL